MESGFVKKIYLTIQTFLPLYAKNDYLTVNNRKSVILCVFMTDNITLFGLYTAVLYICQIFLGDICENSFIKYYQKLLCGFLSDIFVLYLFTLINNRKCFFIRPPPDMLDFFNKLF